MSFIVDGRVYARTTHAATVGAALHDAGWEVSRLDRVVPAVEEPLSSGGTIRLDHAGQIAVVVGGETKFVATAERIPANILSAAAVQLLPGDALWADGLRLADPSAALPRLPARLTLRPAIRVSVNVDGATRWIRTAAATWGEALMEAGIQLHQGDRIVPGADTPPVAGQGAQVIRSSALAIQVDGKLVRAFAAGPTVGDALVQAGVPLVGLDYSVPAADQPLPTDGNIRVVRVVEQIVVEETPIPFETQSVPAADLELDQIKVVDPGAYGMKANRVRILLEDGVEKSRQSDGEWIALPPRARKVGYGTKIVIRTTNTPDGPITYWRAITVYATSYSPCRSASPDGRCMSGTSSGRPVERGMIAAKYSWYILLGNEPVYVPGYGFGSIGDVGHPPQPRWIDLGYSDSDWQEWGSYVTLYFLVPVPANPVFILP